MAVIDTHCHLDLVEKQGLALEAVLADAKMSGVQAVVQIGTTLRSSRWNQAFVENHTGDLQLFWTAGLHPEAASSLADLEELLSFIRTHRDSKGFVGIGETGLDYFHTTEFVENQKVSFQRHIDLAEELRVPLIVHLRDDRQYSKEKTQTVRDAIQMVRGKKNLTGVLHCFTYSYEEAMPFIDLGWFVSYSGIVTYKNAEVLQDGAARLPLGQLMAETDAPYLTPVPHRGKTNQPAYVKNTADFLADLRAQKNGENPDDVRNKLLENSSRFINIAKKQF